MGWFAPSLKLLAALGEEPDSERGAEWKGCPPSLPGRGGTSNRHVAAAQAAALDDRGVACRCVVSVYSVTPAAWPNPRPADGSTSSASADPCAP